MAAWMDDAECRGEDTELFFPAGHRGESTAQIQKAKAVCGRCPVRGACLNAALNAPEKYGIWGGLTDDERDRERRNIRRRQHARPLTEPEPDKTCNGCGETKPAAEFYRRPGGHRGREAQCIACRRQQNRDYKAAKRAAEQTKDLEGIAS